MKAAIRVNADTKRLNIKSLLQLNSAINGKVIFCTIIGAINLVANFSLNAQKTDFCGQAEVTNNWFAKHPALKKNYDAIQLQKSNFINHASNNAQRADSSKYLIPLVFHILHTEGIENISDEQIFDEVAILNRDYQKQNDDTSLIVPAFANNIAKVGFQFKLATIDPNGNCTNGIVRHYTSKSTFWDANKLEDFTYTWPPNKYLNIYVVKKINIATAYTFLPGIGIPDSADVIVCQHNMVGSIGTGTVANSRVLTHEVAHWFDIQHIWGVSNAPGVACGDDLIHDTPETKGFSLCNTGNSNVCDPIIFENVQNYMDYSPCKIMFTNGQADRMYATIASGVNRRNEIFTQQSLASTGVLGSLPCITKADFYTVKNTECIDRSVTYTSLSQFGKTNGSLEWNFQGGSPSSGTDSIVTVYYHQPGSYSVSLKATGANGVNTETRDSIVNIVDGYNGLILPFVHGFEFGEVPLNFKVVNIQGDTAYWQRPDTVFWQLKENNGSNSSFQCFYLNNFSDSTHYANVDYFETPFLDFYNTTSVNFSYYYAYARRYANQVDSFKVQYTLDCGGSWIDLPKIPNIKTMAANSGGTVATEFNPSQAQWKKVTIPPVDLQALNNQEAVKFRFYFKSDYNFDGANNIYIDEININGNVVSSISSIDYLGRLKIYPNPTSSAATIEFYPSNTAVAKIEITDVAGRVHEQAILNVTEGSLAQCNINAAKILNSGIYFANINVNGKKVSSKIVVTGN